MKVFSKEEKIALGIFSVLIVLLTAGGLLYSRMQVKTDYNSILPEASEVLKELNIKSDIKLEVKEEIPNDVGNYLEADESVLSQVFLDFDGVDNQELGQYEIKGKYKNQDFVIPVEVVDTTAPVITAEHNDYTFYIEDSDTVQTVLDYTGITVTDNYDEGLNVEEWISELPSEEGTVTYIVKATDSSGNEGTLEVVIHYVMMTSNNNTTGGNQQGGNTVNPTPTPTPTPTPEPEPEPEPEPQPEPEPEPEPED